MKFYIHLCTAKFHIHNQTVPEGELCFFLLVQVMGTVKKGKNGHGDTS